MKRVLVVALLLVSMVSVYAQNIVTVDGVYGTILETDTQLKLDVPKVVNLTFNLSTLKVVETTYIYTTGNKNKWYVLVETYDSYIVIASEGWQVLLKKILL